MLIRESSQQALASSSIARQSLASSSLKMRQIRFNLWQISTFCAIIISQSISVASNEAEGMKLLLEQRCGSFSTIKVTNGRVLKLASRPWMALIMLGEETACGGTLITNRFVMTAAHCLIPNEPVFVRLGEHDTSTERDCKVAGRKTICMPPVEKFSVSQVFRYGNYNSTSKHNDIALLKLEHPVQFKQHIKPICLPINAELQRQSDTNDRFVVTGWGTTENGLPSPVLREASLDVERRLNCAHIYARTVMDSQICAGGDITDSCRGDSGGPLSYPTYYNGRQRFVQFGIVSYGARACGSGYPGVYTNVASYMPWITNIIGANS